MIDIVLPFEKTGSLLKSAEVVRGQDFYCVLKRLLFGTDMLKPVNKSKLRKSIEYKVYTPVPGGWSCSLKSKNSIAYVTGVCTDQDCSNGKQRAFENALNKLYEYEVYALGSRSMLYNKIMEQYRYYKNRLKS